MIPYGRQEVTQADVDAVVEVLRSDWLTQGPVVPRFEQAVSGYLGAKHALAVNSATSALHIACLALGVGPGDWVWTSPNTFVASANCALYCGAQVDFVDIDPRTYNLSPERLEEKLRQAAILGRLPKVVIPVHFAGQPCDMPAIYALSQRYGFGIIEDASHAVGASYYYSASEIQADAARPTSSLKPNFNTRIGSCAHGHITVFSFHPVKIITTGEGGMALTNDSRLAEKMSWFRTHGITNKCEFMQLRPADEIWNYQQIELGFNYRMTDIQAALGLSQFCRLDEFIQRRHDIAKRYDSSFSESSVITPLQRPETFSSYHLYPIRIRKATCGKSQDQILKSLHSVGIAANIHYIPVYRHPFFEKLGFGIGYCPEAETHFREVVSLPMFSSLKDRDQDHVIQAVAGALRQ